MGLSRIRGNWFPATFLPDPGYGNGADGSQIMALRAGTSWGIDIGVAGFQFTETYYGSNTWQLTANAFWHLPGTGYTFSLLQTGQPVVSADLRVIYHDEAQTSWGIAWFIGGTQRLTKDLTIGGMATDALIGFGDFGIQLDDVGVYDATQSWVFDWSSSAQLNSWPQDSGGGGGNVVIVHGRLTLGTGTQSYSDKRRFRWAQPITPAVAHLQAPVGRPLWFYKSVSAQITEQVGATGGASAILTGDSYGLCHAWMTDQGHRALVYEHSGNLSAALWDGDWEPMLVKDARTKPWAIRLEPSNDVWIPCIDGSNNLKIDRLVWDGSVSTYSVSTTELDTGIDAKDVGGMWIEPNGEVGLAYVNMSDQLAIATGDLSGGSWVL